MNNIATTRSARRRGAAIRGGATLCATVILLNIAGCASLPDWPGVAGGSAANPDAPVSGYTPPPNPFASPVSPDAPASSEPDHQHDQHGGKRP